MNLYERIQQSINYIEEHLDEPISLHDIAKQAYMSRSNLYRLFYAFTGYDVKEYIRRRRINKSCSDLLADKKQMVEIAMDCGFSTQESFIKAFKAVVGITPGSYTKSMFKYNFKKVDLMEKYFIDQSKELGEKYPDIKVLAELPCMRVAAFHTYSSSPEKDGLEFMRDWAEQNGLMRLEYGCRFFGLDYPPFPGEMHGYEWWVTLPDGYQVPQDGKVEEKHVPGGMYALITITYTEDDFIGKLFGAKADFAKWVRESSYGLAFHQYLEEHIVSEDKTETVSQMNMYFPICTDPSTKVPAMIDLPPIKAAAIKIEGIEAFHKTWELYTHWESSYPAASKRKIFQVQNGLEYMFCGPSEFWISEPLEDKLADGFDLKEYPGGKYLRFASEFTSLDSEVANCYKLLTESACKHSGSQMLMEYPMDKEKWEERTLCYLYYPIK